MVILDNLKGEKENVEFTLLVTFVLVIDLAVYFHAWNQVQS